MHKFRQSAIWILLLMISGAIFYIFPTYALVEFVDDYTNEDYVQVKTDIVRNTTYDCMELNYTGDMPLGGWYYRKLHNITGTTDGTQTNYCVSFTVYYGSGTDTTTKVYLDSKCQADFDDIRFTTSDGTTLLDYWIETKTDSNNAVVWVEIDSIPASPSNAAIYLYYGNNGVSSESNGTATFIYYQDFEGETVGNTPDGRVQMGAGAGESFTIANDQYKYGAQSAKHVEVDSTPDANSYWQKTMVTGVGDCVLHQWAYFAPASKNHFWIDIYELHLWLLRDANNDWRYLDGDETYHSMPSWTNPTPGVWYRCEIYFDSSTDLIKYIRDRSLDSGWLTSGQNDDVWDSTEGKTLNTMGVDQAAGTSWYDDVYIRMYANPEPTNGAWGVEEEAGYSVTGSFYTEELISGVGGSTIVLLTNVSLNGGTIHVSFSDDYATWVDHDGIAAKDILMEGFESIDLRDLSYTTFYIKLEYDRGVASTTPRLYQIRVITDAAVGGIINAPKVDFVILNETISGNVSSIFMNCSDVEGLSGYIFEHNETGVYQNTTWAPLVGTSDNILEVITLPAVGTCVYLRFYVNDTDGNWGCPAMLFPAAPAVGGGAGTSTMLGTGFMLAGILGIIFGGLLLIIVIIRKW